MTGDIVNCPYCSFPCEADWVDVGVGEIQCGPYYCQNCKASEIGPFDDLRPLTDEENRTNWYSPESKLGSLVNQFNGKPISHHLAKEFYRAGISIRYGKYSSKSKVNKDS